MTQTELSAHIIAFIEDTYANGTPVSATDRLLEDGIIDSQGMLELISFVEETSGVFVEDNDVDLDNFGSVEAIANYVQQKQAA